MNTIYITTILTITLTTNEVKLGMATIGPKMFDVVGLQLTTNRIVTAVGESWTNTYPGPFVATNLVPIPEASGWIPTNTNFIWWNDIKLTNFISSTNVYLNAN